jgi:multiple sugar transport system ATP-binding protein
MNVVVADLQARDGDAWVSFGGHRLHLDPRTVEDNPELATYDGRSVVVGIRPEDMEDASVVREPHPDWRLAVTCDIREDLGSEVYVHFAVPAEPVTRADVVEALVVESADDEAAHMAAERARGSGVTFVARLERTTSARERMPLEIEVDVTRLHFFDPETGSRIGSSAS